MLWNPYVTQTVSLGYLWLYLIVLPQAVVHQEPLWFLCTLMPSCYNSTLHRHDLNQKSLWKSSGAVFREVRWLDCIFSGCCTLLPNLFANCQCFLEKFFGLIVFSQAVVHFYQAVLTCCYISMIFTKNLFANRQCFLEKFFGLIVFSKAVYKLYTIAKSL